MNTLKHLPILHSEAVSLTPTRCVPSSDLFTFSSVLNDTVCHSKVMPCFKNYLNTKNKTVMISKTTLAVNPVFLPAVNKL